MSAQGQTSKAVLRSLRHMLPSHLPSSITKHQRRIVPTHMRHVPKFVPVKDRIRYWNIVPGDEVKVRAGKSVLPNDTSKTGAGRSAKVRGQGIVQTIDRTKNWAWLRDPEEVKTPLAPSSIRHTIPRLVDPEDPSKGYSGTTTKVPRPVHYSNLLLKVPGTELYASRIVRSKVRFDRTRSMFTWKRFGIVKKEDGSVERIEIPWPKMPVKKKEINDSSAPAAVVNAQSFIPWAPEDPVHYPETFFNRLGRARSTPAGEALAEKLRKLRVYEDELRVAQAPNIRPSNTFPLPPDARGTYAGFDKLYGDPRSKQPIPIAQPPTPEETVTAAIESRNNWKEDPDVKAHIKAGGNAFTPSDYLDLAPAEGPAMGGDWTYGSLPRRSTHAGTPTTLQDVDMMPIELLMRKELANESGLKWRMRAHKVKLAQTKVTKASAETVRRTNLANLRKLLKITERPTPSSASSPSPPAGPSS